MAAETCVCCGEIIPEGRQVCPKCENAAHKERGVPGMNTMDKIKRRVRQIVRAAMGKPADQITIGVEIKHCADCDRGECSDCMYKKELLRLHGYRSCFNCFGSDSCELKPKPGEINRINCPAWVALRPTNKQEENNGTI